MYGLGSQCVTMKSTALLKSSWSFLKHYQLQKDRRDKWTYGERSNTGWQKKFQFMNLL